ncbi:hypothetical protein GCM10023186_16380 [Hymenobacter koreensis]|uniref:Glycosyltransferase RgtA/B/C/D-like domain-containing protein n=1 Tax=Hymenobacter koreensis TaxID=1084523 RepID=A0ABP8IXR9_9BACT
MYKPGRFWLTFGLLLLLAFIPLFWLLGSLPAQQWDESRTGLNAMGIWQHREWLVLRHNGQPDLWNGKPPLWPWILALSFRTIGFTELGLRLPAALAALATVLVVFRAGRHWLGSWPAGLLAALVLLTSQGYVTLHVSRTGDYDALLTLWTTLGALNWLAYLCTGRSRWAWTTGLCFALAVFTKGIAGALFAPGLLLATALLGQWPRLRRPAPWLAAGLVLATMAAWYSIREAAAPGYLAGVWAYEVGGPATTQLEKHYHPLEWYISLLAEHKFTAWLLAALVGWLIGAASPRGSRMWWLSRYTAVVVGCYLLVISLVQTKLGWYDAQAYPLLALQAAGGLTWAGQLISRQLQRRPEFGLQVGAVLLIAAFPYLAQWQHIRGLHQRRFDNAQLLYGRHLQEQLRQRPELQSYTLVTDGDYNDSPLFYATAASLTHGHKVRVFAPWQPEWGNQPWQVVVACGNKATRTVMQRPNTEILVRTDSCLTVILK